MAGEVQQLMEQLGPASPAISHVVELSDTTWMVGVGEDADIFLELDGDQRNLVLSIELGRVPEGERDRLHEMFLGYNALLRDTGGVRLAVVDGEATQHVSVDAATVNLDAMVTLLGNFAENARIWRRVVVGGGSRATGAVLAGLRV